MHTLTFILLIKLVKLCVVTQIKKNLVKKYRKKKQRTSLYKNVTDVYRSTKDLMSKKSVSISNLQCRSYYAKINLQDIHVFETRNR